MIERRYLLVAALLCFVVAGVLLVAWLGCLP
jgi:hypothetical protein